MIEDLAKAHQYTISALGVLGTFLAVLASLSIAIVGQRANRTRISARAAIKQIIAEMIDPGDLDDPDDADPYYLIVDITNRGTLPVVIRASFFYWKLPFQRGVSLVRPLDLEGDGLVARKQYPIKIEAHNSQDFVLSPIEILRADFETFKRKTFGQYRLSFCRAYVASADGKTFKVKLDKSLLSELRGHLQPRP